MAKKLFPFILISFTFLTISCTKSYSCVCTTGTSSVEEGFYPDAKKKDAQEACSKVQDSYNTANPNTTTVCAIK